jgi:hypothetical protein
VLGSGSGRHLSCLKVKAISRRTVFSTDLETRDTKRSDGEICHQREPKKNDKPPAPWVLSPNPFSLLDSAPQPLTETPTRPPSPRVSTRPSTPQELHDIVLEIPSELATVQCRLQTFHRWPLAHITPRQLVGFWHAPSGKDRDSVSCFACDVSVQRWQQSSSHYMMITVYGQIFWRIWRPL